MTNIRTFFINGQYADVPESELDEFMAACEAQGLSPTEVDVYDYEGDDGERQEMYVPEDERDEFGRNIDNLSVTPRRVRKVQMDDSRTLTLGDEDVRQYVQARQTGQLMSRGLLANTKIPDWYGKTREEREMIADELSKMFPSEKVSPDYLKRERNLGDVIADAGNFATDVAKETGRNLVFAPDSEWGDWLENQDGVVGEAIRGANDFSNKAARAVADVPAAVNDVAAEVVGAGERAVGGDGELSRKMREQSADYRQDVEESLPTDTAYVDESLKPFNDFFGDSLITIAKFAIPGMAPIAISSDTANAYYSAYEQAMKSGMSSDKAEALASAKSGATASMGLVLGKAAKGARGKSGFIGALTDMAVTGGEMGALGGVNDVIDQGLEGADNPDLEKTARETAKETIKGAGFSVLSRGLHHDSDKNSRKIAKEEQERAEERFKEESKKIARDEAQTRYESNLSAEALYDIDIAVNNAVKNEVIPSYRQAEEVRRRAIEKLGGREAGESHEAVELAVIEAAQEVNERIQTPSRVETPALERRQAEAKMAQSEDLARRKENVERDLEAKKAENVEDTAIEEPISGNEVGNENASQKSSTNIPTDAGFAAWAVDRSGKPLEFATEKDREVSRALFNDLVSKGRVDGETGKIIEQIREKEAEDLGIDHIRKPTEEPAERVEKEVESEADITNDVATSNKESATTDSYKNAAKTLGQDAFLPEKDLEAKLAIWKKNVNNFAGARKDNMEKQIEAAETILANRKADKAEANEKAKADIVKGEDASKKQDIGAENPKTTESKQTPPRAETNEEVRAKLENDPMLRRIDDAYRKAKTEAERNALVEKLKARVEDLRAANRGKEQSKTDAEEQKLTKEVSKSDGENANAVKNESPIAKKWRQYNEDGVDENGRMVDIDDVRRELQDNIGSIKNPKLKSEAEKILAEYDADYEEYVADGMRDFTNPNENFIKKFEPFLRKLEKDSEQSNINNSSNMKPDGKGRMVKEETKNPIALSEEPKLAEAPTRIDKMTSEEIMNLPDGTEIADYVYGRHNGQGKPGTKWGHPSWVYHTKDGKQFIVTEMLGGGGEVSYDVTMPDRMRFVAKSIGEATQRANSHVPLKGKESEVSPFANIVSSEKPSGRKSKESKTAIAQDAPQTPPATSAQKNAEHTAQTAAKPSEPAKRVPDGKGKMKIEPAKTHNDGYVVDKDHTGGLLLNDWLAANNLKATSKNIYRYNEIRKIEGNTSVEKSLDGTKPMNATETIKKLKAEEKDAKSRWKAERKSLTDQVDAKIREVIGKFGKTEHEQEIAKNILAKLDSGENFTQKDIDAIGSVVPDVEVGEFEVKHGGNGSFKLAGGDIKSLISYRLMMQKAGKEASKRYYEVSDEDIAMRANDNKRRSRAEVVEWAKKSGRQVIDGKVTPDGMREYDAQMAQKAAKVLKRFFPDMQVDYYDKLPNMGGDAKRINMRNKHGRDLGWFEPETKRVVLLPGADAETVAHEIGWHGMRDWAKRNSPKLFEKMREIEDNVDSETRTKVLRLYRRSTGYDRDTLLNEFGAWTFMGRGGKELEKIVSTEEGQKWYANMLSAAKNIYKDYATKHGGNRIDLSKIDTMDGEQFMDFMAKEMAGGKTLGNIGTPGYGKKISTKETIIEAQKRKRYDIGAVFRSIEKAIEKKIGHKIDSNDSVDQAFALRPGMQEAANLRLKAKTDDIKNAYSEYGINHDDFAYYMSCKAATGRDAKVDAKNIKALEHQAFSEIATEFNANNRGSEVTENSQAFKDAVKERFSSLKDAYTSINGSNIDPAEARKTIKEWESGDMAEKTAKLRQMWRDLINETIDKQVEAGLVSKEQAEKWKAEEPEYVPFKSPIDEASGEYFGRGTNLARPEHFEAKGRKTAAGNVLTHALVDWQATQKRAIENDIRQKLAKMVEAHPELGTVEKLGNQKVIEQHTKDGRGEVGASPNVIVFKRNGDSYVIRLNGTRGEAMASAITGRNLSDFGSKGITLPSWMGGKKVTLRDASRVWSSFATEWSPTFAIRNTIKDNIELGNIVVSEMGLIKGSKFAANYAKNQVKNAKDVWSFARDGKIAEGSELDSFIKDGGLIGGMKNEGYGDIQDQFSPKSIEQMMKRGDNKSNAVRHYTLDLIGSVTKMSELATRVNAYAAAKSVGMSGKEAALWSRRAVTDFNRKGENTGFTNVVRMFSNSTLGATARSIKALTTNRHGLEASAMFIGYGYLEAMLEEAMNEDNDEKAKKTGGASSKTVTEYDRQNSALLIRSGDKEYRLPAHKSPFSILKYVGGCIRRVQNGTMTKEQMAKELGLSVATLAFHLTGFGDINFDNQEKTATGAAKSMFASGMPSITQPLVEIMLNTDYAGREVHPNVFGKNDVHSEKGRKNTPDVFKQAAHYLNQATGGTKSRRGWVDVHPESLQKMVEGTGKNALKDVITAYTTFSALLNGDFSSIDTRNTFVKRDFVRDVGDSTSIYYDAKNDFEKDDQDWKGRAKDMSSEEREQYLKDHPWVAKSKYINKITGRIDELRKFEDNKVKTKSGEFVNRPTPFTDEQIEKFKTERQRLQAMILNLMGR